MPDRLTIDGRTLALNGMGLREASVFAIDVYVAGLYLEHPSADASRITNSEQYKQMRLKFVRDVDRDEMGAALRDGFRKSAGRDRHKLQARIDDFESRVPAMKKGDTLTLTYRPGKGVVIATQLGERGTIAGADFAQALFRIWLGREPPDEDVKAGLLGGKCQ